MLHWSVPRWTGTLEHGVCCTEGQSMTRLLDCGIWSLGHITLERAALD